MTEETLRRSARVAAAASTKREPEEVKPKAVIPKKTKSEPKEESKSKEEPKEEPEESVGTKFVKVGDNVPDITLLDQDEKVVKLAEIAKSNKYVVIFAYPKANTPGCTRQACGYRDHHKEFKEEGVVVFGLSADSPKAQKSFETKFNFPYQLLSDPKYELIGPLGAKKVGANGVVRSHWIIKDGKFISVDIGVKPDDSFIDTLKQVKAGE